MSRYSFGTRLKTNSIRLTRLENKNVKATFFERIGSGTSGILEKPKDSTLAFGEWGEGVNALVSEVDKKGFPTYTTPLTSKGAGVTVTLNENGYWEFSGEPAQYPVAIIYVYQQPLSMVNPDRALDRILKVEHYDQAGTAAEVESNLSKRIEALDNRLSKLEKRLGLKR